MPRATQTEIDAWAHCRDPRCAGYSQEQVKAVREVVEVTYLDSGGDMPGVEKSHVYLRFADPADAACGTCGHDREVTDQKRKVYAPLSGKDPNGLLQYKPREPGSPVPVSDKHAEMVARIKELEAELEIGKV